MVAPPMLLIVGVIGGVGAASAYGALHYAKKIGPELTATDLLPMPPPYPPVPRFFYTKPELLKKLRRS